VGWTRREFLQQTALTAAALGFSQTGLSLLSSRYQQALAQPTRRKLALLVGINQYPDLVSDSLMLPTRTDRSAASSAGRRDRLPVRGTLLNGCLTDVELQQELLIHRFGFDPSDVFCLTDQQATRQGIEDAFLSHLSEQAQPGDAVVFHFSGMGSRVKLAAGSDCNTLVPIDGILPTEENPVINDLFETTLSLLLQSLPTDCVTVVLDTSTSNLGRALQGNLRVRSRPHAPTGQINEAELALQEQLRHASKPAQAAIFQPSNLPGVVLLAAQTGQVAAEGQWGGFSAGVFTYALTQQLWSATAATALQVSFSRAAVAVEQRVGNQQPQWHTQNQRNLNSVYAPPADSSGAAGVITAIDADGKTVQLWLGGIPAIVLEHYGINSLLTCHPAVDALPQPILQIRSRDGLKAVASVIQASPLSQAEPIADEVQVGQQVQEAVRVLPRDVSLTVALDPDLERIERVDATSAFAAIAHVSIAAVEQPADYLFGKMPPAPALTASLPTASAEPPHPAELPPVKNSYGLFDLGQAALPKTFVETEEAIKTAASRLVPQLRALLAAKLLRLTDNSGSARLRVRAVLETIAPGATTPQPQILQSQETAAPWSTAQSTIAPVPLRFPEEAVPTLPITRHIQYRLHNDSDRPVYFTLIGFDRGGGAVTLCPTPTSADDVTPGRAASDRIIPPGTIVTLPATAVAEWVPYDAAGLVETFLIFSRSPLTQTSVMLAEATGALSPGHVNAVANPLAVAQAVLQDLHQASFTAGNSSGNDAYVLDINCWATLSFAYRVTAA
jgi:hypothetical protein